MKKLALSLAAMFTLSLCKAQGSFSGSSKLFSIGVGVGSPFFGSGYKQALPVNPTINFEKGVSDNISAGASISYAGSKLEVYDLKYNAFLIGARAAYHFIPGNEKIDAYAGGGLGYVIVSVSSKSSGYATAASSGIGYMAFAGGRYYFTKATAVYAELGYSSLSFLNAGITFKF